MLKTSLRVLTCCSHEGIIVSNERNTMSLGVTLYIITTLILFAFNMIANVVVLSVTDKKNFPTATFLATLFAIVFLIWGITLLVTS